MTALVFVLAMAAGGVVQAGSDGVTQDEVVIGVSAAFRGSTAALGSDLVRGSMAWFNKVNVEGGINGRRIRPILLDDGYDPPRTVQNAIRLLGQDKVFCLFDAVGTPTTVRMLPLLKLFEARGTFLFGAFTGAQSLREPPYGDFVVNVRASYRQETEALVDLFLAAGKRKIGCLYQRDAYGISGLDGVRRALAARGLSPVAEVNYQRGGTFDKSQAEQAKLIMAAGADAVICIGAYQPCGAFVRDARQAGFSGPIANISFVGADALLGILKEYQQKTGRQVVSGLVNSQVVPSYDDVTIPIVAEYRATVDRYPQQLPEELRDPSYKATPYSFGGLEGFINARIFTAVLEKAGRWPTTEAFTSALAQFAGVDLGIGDLVTFGPGDRQALDRVFLTIVAGDRWVPLSGPSQLP
jgi:ABC-type branched-subunit amino acid transport system substrate-binding protein